MGMPCASAYQQCGGMGWVGPTCCQAGCKCGGSGGYYMQCTPPLGSSTCSSVPSNGLVPSNVQPNVPAATPTPTLSPTPAPLPVLQPTAAITISPTLLPTLAPVASLSSAGMQCARLFGQCGGKNWKGTKCCSGQATCKAIDQYYSQCVASIASDSRMVVRKDAQIPIYHPQSGEPCLVGL